MTTGRKILAGTLLAGTLDILSAVVYTLLAGKEPVNMLKGIAAAALGTDPKGGAGLALAGLAIHFAIMAVMVAVFVTAANRIAALRTHWLLAGIAYGIGLWGVMNLMVLPAKFGYHPFHALGLAEQLFSHIALVGIPIAWIARR
ncbi:MAG: hypothetical protein JSR79_06435 [Proteobacteria bacterium]|nr:hypothetical protein [Pseudomonadota bacterium]